MCDERILDRFGCKFRGGSSRRFHGMQAMLFILAGPTRLGHVLLFLAKKLNTDVDRKLYALKPMYN